MIKVNAHIYAAAQDEVRRGRWTIDPLRGVINPATGRIAGGRNTSGHLRLRFALGDKYASVLAHRVMWEAIHGTIPVGLYVNHIDGNKVNNAIANLEIVTHRENMQHAHDAGLFTRAGRWLPSVSTLPVEVVREICRRGIAGESRRALAAEFEIAHSTVSRICSGDRWASFTEDIRSAA